MVAVVVQLSQQQPLVQSVEQVALTEAEVEEVDVDTTPDSVVQEGSVVQEPFTFTPTK